MSEEYYKIWIQVEKTTDPNTEAEDYENAGPPDCVEMEFTSYESAQRMADLLVSFGNDMEEVFVADALEMAIQIEDLRRQIIDHECSYNDPEETKALRKRLSNECTTPTGEGGPGYAESLLGPGGGGEAGSGQDTEDPGTSPEGTRFPGTAGSYPEAEYIGRGRTPFSAPASNSPGPPEDQD